MSEILPQVFISPSDTWEQQEAQIFVATGKRMYDEEPVSDAPDPGTVYFDKFFETCSIAGSLQKDRMAPGMGFAIVERFEEACAPIDERATAAFRKLDSDLKAAEAREGNFLRKTPVDASLAKRGIADRVEVSKTADGRKVERHFSSDGTSCVVAEFNEDGTVRKTYIEET